jgi:hypothetical protein
VDERTQILADARKLSAALGKMALPTTAKKAALVLGVSERTVTKLCTDKGLGIRIGDCWLVDIAQILDSAAGTARPDQVG